MSNVFKPKRHAALVRRLGDLRSRSSGKWGRMTAHQAVCHLNDSFKAVLGDRPLEPKPIDMRRQLKRFAAFTMPIPWPKGVPTSARVDAEKGGTPPGAFETDVAELGDLLRRFVETDGRTLMPHYVWGKMSRGEWGRYGYRHVDHHLRQFGV